MPDPFEIPPQRAEAAGDRDLIPVSGLDDLPPPPPRQTGDGQPAVRKSSATNPAPPAAGKEDIPFPLPPDWFERKAAEKAAKAAETQTKVEASAAPSAPEQAPPPPPPPPRARASADLMRTVAQRASGEHRQEDAERHGLRGDELASQGRWREAAIEFEHAVRKAATPYEAQPFVARAAAARSRLRLRRVLAVTLATIILVGGLGFLAWRFSPQLRERFLPSDGTTVAGRADGKSGATAAAPGATSSADSIAAISMLSKLEFDAQDEQKPWSMVAAEAVAALAMPGVDHKRAQAVSDRAGPPAAKQAREFAAIQEALAKDPLKALELSAAFRLGNQRAGDYLAKLPLPGRLVVRGADPALATATYDGTALALGADGEVRFCRKQKAAHLEVEAPGYVRFAIDLPADADAQERLFTATLQEAPLWTVPAPATAPAWMALRASSGTLITISDAAAKAWSAEDGHALGTLDAHGIAGVPAAACTWSALPEATPGELWLSTSTGAVIGAGIGANGFTAPRLLHLGDRPAASLDFGKLVFQLDKPVTYTAVTGPKGEASAEADDKRLWTLALSATIPPRVRAKGEFVVAIDDLRVVVLNQDGSVARSLALPRPRIGAVQAFDGGRLLVVPTAGGACVLRGGGDLMYAVAGEIPEARAVVARGDLLFGTTRDHTIAAWRLAGDAFQPAWSVPLPGGHSPDKFDLSAGFACCADDGDMAHVVDLASHALRSIQLDQEITAAPLVLGDRVVVADRLGQVRAYSLAKPGAKR